VIFKNIEKKIRRCAPGTKNLPAVRGKTRNKQRWLPVDWQGNKFADDGRELINSWDSTNLFTKENDDEFSTQQWPEYHFPSISEFVPESWLGWTEKSLVDQL
jgi:hypothetical protein